MSNTVCCFHFSIVNQGKNISEAPKELENQPCRKFESCMIGETVGWYLRKNLVLFGWKGRAKKIPTTEVEKWGSPPKRASVGKQRLQIGH